MLLTAFASFAQPTAKSKWVDSVFQSLSPNERIAQLMVIRTSGMDAAGNPVFYNEETFRLVKDYNVGAVCLFQGTPDEQAALLNAIQAMAKTPVMVTVDGEWGLGMRFKGVENFPYQLTLGALPDATLVYETGKAIAEQCRRMNIHVNYAPVVDINNNPANPVIGVRSFGEDKYKVALMGTRIMEGMQDNGVMACAKHFPGHGDVSVDSHHDLPVIEKPMESLQQLELYPFRSIFSKGVGSVMVAHLYIPAIDTTTNRATSLSPQNINGLLRNELGYQGLTFTDALEMKGVAKFYPGGEAAVQSLVAGNDMLCLPQDVGAAINEINNAIASGRLSAAAIDAKCKKVLEAKYDYVYGKTGSISFENLTNALNSEVAGLRKKVAEQSFTLLKNDLVADRKYKANKPLYLMFSSANDTALTNQLNKAGWQVMHLPARSNIDDALLNKALKQVTAAPKVFIGLHNLNRSPSNSFGMHQSALGAIEKMKKHASKTGLILFGNPYALATVKAIDFATVTVAYEDDSIFRANGVQWLTGKLQPKGTLPVSTGSFTYGSGIVTVNRLPQSAAETNIALTQAIDSIALEGISEKAFPGCVVTAVHKGKVVFQKTYGNTTYEGGMPMHTDMIFDLASVTKTSATTLAVMKLYEEGKLKLDAGIGEYLPWLKGTDKAQLTVENLLLHQAGLVAWIPFYRQVIDDKGNPLPAVFSTTKSAQYSVDVSNRLFMNQQYMDSMYTAIASSNLVKDSLAYVYSDNDFILLANIVHAISGKRIDDYVAEHFYTPLGLLKTGFSAYQKFPLNSIVPTENEVAFRQGLIWGYVHDPGAAMFGNVAGHAGLFSNVHDLAIIYQMLLNGGKMGSKQYFKPQTIAKFTQYQTPISRRGLGWDKPSKNNAFAPTPNDAYPANFLSSKSFGHTGFTGTCVWADPENELIYIFLSNRVYPNGGDNRKLLTLNIRGRIHDAIYQHIITAR